MSSRIVATCAILVTLMLGLWFVRLEREYQRYNDPAAQVIRQYAG